MALVILAAGAFLWHLGGSGRVEAASVAVLPFVDLSPERSHAYLGDGMAETLINALTNVEGLNVAARTSAFSFRDAAKDVRRIGRELGVATVLEGSVQRAGDRLRVTAQLVKTSDGLHLWSENFDRDSKDIFAVQDEVARAVVAALKGKLVARAGSATTGGTTNPAAYDAFLLGRFSWNKRTPDDLVRAADYFSQAIRADSSYARAWSGLADSYVLFIPAEYDVPDINPDSILSLAEAAARHAIALAPGLGEAYSSLGQILQYRLKWVEAREAFERGIALSPDYATGHQWYAYNLMMRNQWDVAMGEMERAKQLDPLSLIIITSLGFAYDGAERWGEAEAQFDQARAIAPDHLLTRSFGCTHALLSGDYAQAAADYRGYVVATGGDTSHAALVERRIRDPSLRTEGLREAAGAWVNFAVAIHRVLDGEGTMLPYLEKLVDDPGGSSCTTQICTPSSDRGSGPIPGYGRCWSEWGMRRSRPRSSRPTHSLVGLPSTTCSTGNSPVTSAADTIRTATVAGDSGASDSASAQANGRVASTRSPEIQNGTPTPKRSIKRPAATGNSTLDAPPKVCWTPM
jgi:TolB-like protein